MGLHTAVAVKHGSTVISGLQGLDLQTNPNVESDSNSGSPFPQFAVITSQKPRVMFATKQIGPLLGVTGVVGTLIDATNPLVAYYASLAANGLPAAGSVHRSYTANRGLLLPRRLSVAAQGNAQVDTEALLYSSDGTSHPLTIADNVALPTLPLNNVQHAMGPITLGITLAVINPDCLQNFSIDFGNGAETIGCGGNLYDQHLQVPRSATVITFTGIDAAVFGSSGVPPVGMAFDHTATTMYLRKRAVNGIGFVADATAEHIKMTANGVAVVTQHTGQGTARAEVTVQLTLSWDGTTAPLTINTASAIT